MSEHSQLPWKWHRRSAGAEHMGAIYMEKRPGHAYAIAMQPRYVEDDQWEADAAFLVKAVNSHNDLVAIVKRLADGERSEPGHDALRNAAIEAMEKAK